MTSIPTPIPAHPGRNTPHHREQHLHRGEYMSTRAKSPYTGANRFEPGRTRPNQGETPLYHGETDLDRSEKHPYRVLDLFAPVCTLSLLFEAVCLLFEALRQHNHLYPDY